MPRIYTRRPLRERLLEKIMVDLDGPRPVDDAPCWVWQGNPSQVYGLIRLPDGSQAKAHRVVYELWYGPIPDGYHVDHLCFNKRCCNPAHLEAVTPRENKARSPTIPVPRLACKHGHEFTEENTYYFTIDTGRTRRYCRTCRRERNRRDQPKYRRSKQERRKEQNG